MPKPRPTEHDLDVLPKYSVVEATFMDGSTGVIRVLVKIGSASMWRWAAVGGPLKDQWSSARLLDEASAIEVMR